MKKVFYDLKTVMTIVGGLKPSISRDGNQWCILYGDFPNDCIVGFGDTPHMAMQSFVNNFYRDNISKVNV